MRSADDEIDPRVLRLTLVALVVTATGHWAVRFPTIAVGTLLIVEPRLAREPAAWLAVAAAVATRIAYRWPLADNHIYLFAYWALAVALALRSRAPAAALAASARWLVALVFAFAVLWKCTSPEFVDGRFFRVTLLTDERFAAAVEVFGGLTKDELAENRDYLKPSPGGVAVIDGPELREPAAFRRFTAALTWSALALEGLIAAAFLAPLGAATRWLRHAALVSFCATAYAIAPVAGFAWLLSTMGLAQSGSRAWSNAYVASFLLALAYSEVPWVALARNALSG